MANSKLCICVHVYAGKREGEFKHKVKYRCVLGWSSTQQLHGCRTRAAFYPFIGLKTRFLSLLFDFSLQLPAFGRSSIVLPHTDTCAISQAYLHTTTLHCYLIIFHSNERVLSSAVDCKMKDSLLFFKSNKIENLNRLCLSKSWLHDFCGSCCFPHHSIIRSLYRCILIWMTLAEIFTD